MLYRINHALSKQLVYISDDILLDHAHFPSSEIDSECAKF